MDIDGAGVMWSAAGEKLETASRFVICGLDLNDNGDAMAVIDKNGIVRVKTL